MEFALQETYTNYARYMARFMHFPLKTLGSGRNLPCNMPDKCKILRSFYLIHMETLHSKNFPVRKRQKGIVGTWQDACISTFKNLAKGKSWP